MPFKQVQKKSCTKTVCLFLPMDTFEQTKYFTLKNLLFIVVKIPKKKKKSSLVVFAGKENSHVCDKQTCFSRTQIYQDYVLTLFFPTFFFVFYKFSSTTNKRTNKRTNRQAGVQATTLTYT